MGGRTPDTARAPRRPRGARGDAHGQLSRARAAPWTTPCTGLALGRRDLPMAAVLPDIPPNSLPAPSGEGERVEPYASSFEHLRAELERLDLRVRMQVFRTRRARGD